MRIYKIIKHFALYVGFWCIAFSTPLLAQQTKTYKKWAIAQFGDPLYFENLSHLPYANPDAPKGGRVVLSAFGSFETLNFYVNKGDWPGSIGLVYDSLMTGNSDELDGLYGSIAESVEYPEDKSWAVFTIRPKARYHDGQPIVAEDFVYAFETATQRARPFVRSFYTNVVSAEALSSSKVKFVFATKNSMKPVTVVASLSPLPVHYWKDKDPTKATLEPPLSSGPYQVIDVQQGRSITYQRVKNWWARDLPINRGLYNYDQIRYEYYKDLTVEFEAFKAGEVDFRSENSAKRWVKEYDFKGMKTGEVIKVALPDNKPRGMSGYFFNLRRDKFKDIRVRQALMTLYDFETLQRTLLYGLYKRIDSDFPNSDYAAIGPPSDAERSILMPFRQQLPKGVLEQAFKLPVTDGTGRDRKNKRQALALFRQAGWQLKQGKLVSDEGEEQFSLELMTAYPESQRLTLPYVQILQKMGIDASIRLVDTAQWRTRIHDFDFDLFVGSRTFIVPPGPELRSYFGSQSADVRGGNSSGIKNPVADTLIDQIVDAKDLPTLINTTKALDRVLWWNYYAVPTFFNDETWIAYWDRFSIPKVSPKYAIGFLNTWWIDPEKDKALGR